MKRVGYLFDSIVDVDNLLLAFYKAQRGKSWSKDVAAFRSNLQDNIVHMRQKMIEGCMEVGRYHTFTIFDPKERLICAAHFEERVLHHAIMNVCHPFFERHLIADTYASRVGKGTYAALNRAMCGTRSYDYVAKLDFRKYFDSIRHDVLMCQLEKMFKDERLLSLLFDIIDSYSQLPGRGVPIGNLTSQYFANHYLSALDHYMKENQRVPLYVRYMDDILLFGNDRRQIQAWVAALKQYAEDFLGLLLKPVIIHTTSCPTNFLGYNVSRKIIMLSQRSRRRFEEKMTRYMTLLNDGEWNEDEFLKHVTPLLAFTCHAYSKRCRQRIMQRVESRMPLIV